MLSRMTLNAMPRVDAARRSQKDVIGSRRTARGACRTLVVAALSLAIAGQAAAALAATSSIPAPTKQSSAKLDAAGKRAVELQRRLNDLAAEQTAIQLRLDATTARLAEQEKVLAAARQEVVRARETVRRRAVAAYKSEETDALVLLLASGSWEDLVTRASYITLVLDSDSHLLREAEELSAKAEHEARVLADIRREDLALRAFQRQRVASARTALAEQNKLVATLSDAARRALAAQKAAGTLSAKQWKDSSTAAGSSVPKVAATVLPYTGVTFLAAYYAPRRFRATGTQFSGLASWYGKAVDGHKTASGRIFNHEDFTCAHRSLPFGTWLAVTRGDRRVIVVVTDRGPYVAGRVLDLSEAAAKALDIGGVKTVSAEVVVPAP